MSFIRTTCWGCEPQGDELGAKPEAKIDELSDRDARRGQLVSVEEHTFAFFQETAPEAKEQPSKGSDGGTNVLVASNAMTGDGERTK